MGANKPSVSLSGILGPSQNPNEMKGIMERLGRVGGISNGDSIDRLIKQSDIQNTLGPSKK